ncbi:MAG: hypothetical protein ACM3U2_23390, partial [Deltaproteobacteria bacterium]
LERLIAEGWIDRKAAFPDPPREMEQTRISRDHLRPCFIRVPSVAGNHCVRAHAALPFFFAPLRLGVIRSVLHAFTDETHAKAPRRKEFGSVDDRQHR